MHKAMPNGSSGFADIVIMDVRVMTMDPARPMAQAVALQCEIILAVGSGVDMVSVTGPDTAIIHGGGATLLPGFFESHCHLFLGGSELGNLDLAKLVAGQNIPDVIRMYAAANPDRQILVVQGADYAMFADCIPRIYLDGVLPDRAIALMSGDHHTVWANTAALRDCGLLHGKVTADGSEVVVGGDRLATGELREPGAFASILPAPVTTAPR